MKINKDSTILLFGSGGFLGRHVVAALEEAGFANIMAVGRSQCDVTEQDQVRRLFARHRPEAVINCAGVVGGIKANEKNPAVFCYDNLMMGTMLLHEAYRSGARKYLACICGCGYPNDAKSPIKEEYLWQGYPHPISAPYSIAKKMTVVQAQAYRQQYGFNSVVLVPGNMYGPYDNFHLEDAHVIPALLHRTFLAKREKAPRLMVWGSGVPVRDFVYAGDVARALVVALLHYDGAEIINISSGRGVSIRALAERIVSVCGYDGELCFDSSKPDGQLHKVFSVDKMERLLDYRPATSLSEGLKKTFTWFVAHYPDARK